MLPISSARAQVEARERGLLTSTQFCEETGLTHRQVVYWTRSGLLFPDVKAQGSGSSHLWSHSEVSVGRALRQMIALGCQIRGPLPDAVCSAIRAGESVLAVGPFLIDLERLTQ